jgi:chromosome segregation ATPase
VRLELKGSTSSALNHNTNNTVVDNSKAISELTSQLESSQSTCQKLESEKRALEQQVRELQKERQAAKAKEEERERTRAKEEAEHAR